MEYYQEDEDLIPTSPNRRIIIVSLAIMEYDQYQEDEHLIPTSPAWAVLLKVIFRSIRLAPKVDGFDDDVSGHKNDNEEIWEIFLACSFGEWANILKVM